MSKDEMKSSSSPSSSPLTLADLDAKLDRIAGQCAQAIVQSDRAIRVFAANAQLDVRTKREMQDVLTETRAVLAQVRDSRTALVKQAEQRADFAPAPRKRADDSITASFKLEMRGKRDDDELDDEPKKKKIRIILAIIKAAAAIAAGAAGHWLWPGAR